MTRTMKRCPHAGVVIERWTRPAGLGEGITKRCPICRLTWSEPGNGEPKDGTMISEKDGDQ